MAPGRLSRPGWKILGGAALAGLVWFGLPRALRHVDFFLVRKVEVRGQRNLRAEDLVRELPLRPGLNLFDDLGAVQRAVDTLPGLRDARVSRKLPGTLVVTVHEAPPVALVLHQGRLQLVSEGGRVLPFDPTVGAPDLPLIREPDSLVTRLLARVRDADATLFAQVESGWREGDDVVLAAGGRRYLFRPDAPAEIIRAVTAVVQDLAKKGRPWAELDARYAGQIVVRRVAA
ncbi:MAG TPA: FtsQ-type POTRA domain-containing protein [Gemmatimonadales bacterium]|nr:FtsQ-type POTRA domain-containing protein [Gemmatimonadales bacterium]